MLIEATCNQVNQEGGYTGMTPADFRAFVEGIADRVGFPRERLILGGDHLGPNPWKHLPADEAMAEARTMVAAYVKAGFTKIHLDTSMGCAGERARSPTPSPPSAPPTSPPSPRPSTPRRPAAGLRHRHRGPGARRRRSTPSTTSR